MEGEDGLEETRRCLLNMYHSNIQTHAGYLIGIIIGSLALFSRMDTFFGTLAVFVYSDWFFLFLLWLIIIAFIWNVLRIVYWTSYVNNAITLSAKEAAEKFNRHNVKRKEKGESYYVKTNKPPLTIMFQRGIEKWHEETRAQLGLHKKIALITAKNLWSFVIISIVAGLLMIIFGLIVFQH